jgi:hypothetical protein
MILDIKGIRQKIGRSNFFACLTSPSFIVLFISILTIFASVIFTELESNNWESERPLSAFGGFLFVLLFILPYLLCVLTISYGIYISFRKGAKTGFILMIIASYMALILTFTGIYYSMAYIGDIKTAMIQRNYYSSRKDYLNKLFVDTTMSRDIFKCPYDSFAFRGMSRLWSLPEDFHIGWTNVEDSVTQGVKSVDKPARFSVKFLPQNRSSVLIDCFHLSVVTITTLGYGDISPKHIYSKLATDVEVISGITLAVVALGIALGDKRFGTRHVD